MQSCDGVAPFMRAMECIPEAGEESDNENPIIASITKSFHSGSFNAANMKSDASEKLQDLQTRLEAFWSKGWVSKNEYQQHVDFLSSFDITCIGSNEKWSLKELEKEFDTMESEKSNQAPQSWSDMFMSTLGVSTSKAAKTTSSAGLSSFWSNSMAVSTSHSEDEEVEVKPLATATNRSVKGTRAPSIVPPRDLSNVLSEEAIQDLFVETCFFGRLGFVQPPCCMQCVHKEALKGNLPDSECQNWVVWRKNGNRSFDPSNNADLADNALVMKCQTARKLSSGKMVEGYQWDTRQKVLLRRTLQ